jgi:5-formyltetrahydrofolate cyclo-ligase
VDQIASKVSLRRSLLAARRLRSAADRTQSAAAIAAHASSIGALSAARRVAGYLSSPTEPGTGELIEALQARGIEVIVPRSMPDFSMQWAQASASTQLGAASMPEPTAPTIAGDPLADCHIAFVPALAVDHAGHRLGRGAGFYDRALASFSGIICAVVFTEELLPVVPHEDHDVCMHMALTPSGVFRVPGAMDTR